MKNTRNCLQKAAIILFMSIALIMTMGACTLFDTIDGSGNIVTEVHDLSDFDAVKAGGTSDVEITLGDNWHVELTTDDNLHEYLEIFLENGALRIKTRKMVNLRPTDKLLVRVIMPALNEIVASGASNIIVESEIVQSDLSVRASGSSDVYLQVSLDKLTVRCSGSSDIHIGGYSKHATVSASGSSDFRGKAFTCDEAEVNLSGSSDMYASIREKVSGRLSGSSDLHINGSPDVRVRTSGSSGIRYY